MKKYFFFIILGFCIWFNCGTKFEACFTVDKSVVKIGDTITFSNCSKYDKGKIDAFWVFGDSNEAYSKGNESVKHAYNVVGRYEVVLRIGYPEHGSKKKNTILVQ